MSALQQVIPEGYKQTEIGVIPEDWEVKKLKEISPSQSVGLVINPSSYYSNSGTIPMLVGSHVFENKIKWSKANKITAESNLRLPASRLKTGDLVTVRVGEPGITAVVPPELNQSNCASMMIIRQGPKFDSHWLCFLMNSKIGKSRIEGVQYGTAQKQFNIIDAVDFLFPFPTKEEQTAIANALSDMDALLSELEKLIAKKQAIKTATMQQLLTGKTRLPQFAFYSDINSAEGTVEGKRKHSLATNVNVGACDDGYLASQESVGMDSRRKGTKPSELGEIPEDWDAVPANKAVEFFGGYGFSSRLSSDSGVKWLKIANVGLNEVKWDADSYLPESIVSSFKSYSLKENDVVMALTRPLLGDKLKIARIASTDLPALLNQRVAKLITKGKNRLDYIFYVVQRAEFIAQMNLAMAGTDPPNIGTTALGRINILLPEPEEQTAIASILSDMDNEIQNLEQRLSKTRQIKQGMMQELLTGKTRLPFDKDTISEVSV